jgi:hypothetical protein
MTAKEIVLETYPKAQCCSESDYENLKNKNKKYIICRKIRENQIEKLSIGEKYYNTPNEAWDNALIYVNNKNVIENLDSENTRLKLKNLNLKAGIFLAFAGGILLFMSVRLITNRF